MAGVGAPSDALYPSSSTPLPPRIIVEQPDGALDIGTDFARVPKDPPRRHRSSTAYHGDAVAADDDSEAARAEQEGEARGVHASTCNESDHIHACEGQLQRLHGIVSSFTAPETAKARIRLSLLGCSAAAAAAERRLNTLAYNLYLRTTVRNRRNAFLALVGKQWNAFCPCLSVPAS
jgi:hypothetical protein